MEKFQAYFAIRKVINDSMPHGITSFNIAKKTNLPLKTVRNFISMLRKEGLIYFVTRWWGKNAGYSRYYKEIK